MDPVVLAAGTALVSAMATDAWQQARAAAVAWWGSVRPGQAEPVGDDLDSDRTHLLTARDAGDADTEDALVGAWRLRLHHLLSDHPDAAQGLQVLLEDQLQPVLGTGEKTQIGTVLLRAQARDNARVYMAGRDQHITGS
jgi:hypothetical protein